MDERILLKVNQFKQPRIKGIDFKITPKEEANIKDCLDRLQSIIPQNAKILLCLYKIENFFCGSVEIKTLYIFAFAKETSVTLLHSRLEIDVKIQITNCPYLIKNPIPIEIHL